ncbi:MAG: tyrosine recombinase XerC [Tissierellia bacterium]|nr:tyrosine recombinase XerC [Tissierellia bacterium]
MYKDIPIFLNDFLDYLKTIKSLAPSSIHEYYLDLRLFLKFIEYRKSPIDYDGVYDIDVSNFNIDLLKKVNLIDLHSYLAFRDDSRDNSSTTRARKISSLRSFYKYMTNIAKLLDDNPSLELESPKLKKRNPVYLTLDESKKLLSTISKEPNEIMKRRDFAIVLIFLTTGIRLSELASMNVNSIRDMHFSVVGKGNKERTVYMTEACQYAINEYLAVRPKIQDQQALFLSTRKNRMSNRAIQHMIDKYLNQAGFDIKKFSTHKLRHTAATLMYKEGVDIRTLQKILGHTSVATTQIYTHVEDEDMRDAVKHNPLSDIKVDG